MVLVYSLARRQPLQKFKTFIYRVTYKSSTCIHTLLSSWVKLLFWPNNKIVSVMIHCVLIDQSEAALENLIY